MWIYILDAERFPEDDEYPGLYTGPYGPSRSAMKAAAESPLALFLYLMPKRLWSQISIETNRYHRQQIPARAGRIKAKQKATGKKPETRAEIRTRLRMQEPIQPHELLRVVGLLIARTLCPHKQRMTRHWAPLGVGAVPTGTFGKFLPRARFDAIMQSLHFTDNEDERAKTDRAWKVRSVVETLQTTFRRGYTTPPVLSFDEGVLPSRSRYNPTRQYLKDKPHKWGTKLFVTCCAVSAYCLRYVHACLLAFFFIQSSLCWIFQHTY